MLDVAIGMIFIYLLLSLIVSTITELIEVWLKTRSSNLERGIRELLQDSANTTKITEQIYNHPLVLNLYKGRYESKHLKNGKYRGKSNLPSYIPSKNFALALMGLVLPSTATQTGGTSFAAKPFAAGQPTPAGIPNVSPLVAMRNATVANPILSVNKDLQTALLSLIDAAGDDANKARENIENWFNSSMDRISGWYKRRVQIISFVLGIFVAILFNVDSFAVFKGLVSNRPVREAIVSSASMSESASLLDSSQDAAERLDSLEKRLSKFDLPLGWVLKGDKKNGLEVPQDGWSWIIKVFGWLTTGLALSFGAPFWFDLLNKVMVIRSTVKPREKSREEGSEDRT